MNCCDEAEPIVFVVDDEEGMRQALRRLFRTAGLAVQAFASGAEFISAYRPQQRGCLVLDLNMPKMNGLQLQDALQQRGLKLPIIFLTGAGRVADAVDAMRAGAEDFLEKPFEPELLLGRVQKILARCGEGSQPPYRADYERRLILLTAREREVMEMTITGKTSKEMARLLGGSHRTIEIHRARFMQKMQVGSVAELVRMALLGGSAPPEQGAVLEG